MSPPDAVHRVDELRQIGLGFLEGPVVFSVDLFTFQCLEATRRASMLVGMDYRGRTCRRAPTRSKRATEAALAYCTPRSEWWMSPGAGRRSASARGRARRTSGPCRAYATDASRHNAASRHRVCRRGTRRFSVTGCTCYPQAETIRRGCGAIARHTIRRGTLQRVHDGGAGAAAAPACPSASAHEACHPVERGAGTRRAQGGVDARHPFCRPAAGVRGGDRRSSGRRQGNWPAPRG